MLYRHVGEKDGYIRQELLSTGRYDEARGNRKSAYTGSYFIEGNHIEYVDDSGFTVDGDFRDDVLYHGGYVFCREKRSKVALSIVVTDAFIH